MFGGDILASAAEAQHVGRHSADLRLVAAAAAADDCRFFTAQNGPGDASPRSRRLARQPLYMALYAR
jgi:hypothetical protein